MTLDPARATFALAEYRYETATDATVKSIIPGSRTLELDTNIASTVGAAAIASQMLAQFKTPALAFNVEVQDTEIASLDEFDGSPPVFTADFERFGTGSGRTMLPAAVTIDWQTMTTTVTLRG